MRDYLRSLNPQLPRQVWLLQIGGRKILIDSCCGNNKFKPNRPFWTNLNTDYPERLAVAGGTTEHDLDSYRLYMTAWRARAHFEQALTIARREQAKSWELRAAMSMGRMWLRDGRFDDARALLTPIYDWFTEGFDTADLQDTKALLEQLS